MLSIELSHNFALNQYSLFTILSVGFGIGATYLTALKKQFPLHKLALVIGTTILCLLLGGKLIVFDLADWKSLIFDGVLPTNKGKSALGVLVGALFGIWVSKKILGIKEPIADLFAVSIPLGLGIQRIGCLLAGCCFGTPTDSIFSVVYGLESPAFFTQQSLGLLNPHAEHTHAVHPTQLYEMLACLLISLFAWKNPLKWKSNGSNLLASVLLYLVFRFFNEFLRYSTRMNQVALGLNGVQIAIIIALALLAFILYLLETGVLKSQTSYNNKIENINPYSETFLPVFLGFIHVVLNQWFTYDENLILLLFVWPVILYFLVKKLTIFGFPALKLGGVALLFSCFLWMGQMPDANQRENYTTLDISAVSGTFFKDVRYGGHWQSGMCGDYIGNYQTARMQYNYTFVGGGLSKHIEYRKKRFVDYNLRMYTGLEKVRSIDGQFENGDQIFGLSPSLDYNSRLIGTSIGFCAGILNHSNIYGSDDTRPNPFLNTTNVLPMFRLRLGPEKYAFVELTHNNLYNPMGQSLSNMSLGTRFNSNKGYLLKLGVNILSENYGDEVFPILVSGGFPIGKKAATINPMIFITKEMQIGQIGFTYKMKLNKNL